MLLISQPPWKRTWHGGYACGALLSKTTCNFFNSLTVLSVGLVNLPCYSVPNSLRTCGCFETVIVLLLSVHWQASDNQQTCLWYITERHVCCALFQVTIPGAEFKDRRWISIFFHQGSHQNGGSRRIGADDVLRLLLDVSLWLAYSKWCGHRSKSRLTHKKSKYKKIKQPVFQHRLHNVLDLSRGDLYFPWQRVRRVLDTNGAGSPKKEFFLG